MEKCYTFKACEAERWEGACMYISGCKEYSFTDVQNQHDQAQAAERRGYS